MNGHKQNQWEMEHSMAEPNGHTADANMGFKDEKQMAAEPLNAESQTHEIDAYGLKRRRRRCCYFSCAAVVVVIIITIVILALTVFKVRDPKIAVTSMSVDGIKASVDNMKVHLNLTIMAGMAVKNPNKIASFKHGNSTTIILYRGATVGEAALPAGKIKADKTVNKNVTVTVFVDEFMDGGSNLLGDGTAGSLNLTTRTEIAGRVKLLGMIKKHISVRMACDITVDVKSMKAEMQSCHKNVKF